MAPLEDGGIVDPRLRVYGIPNLRVVDASIMGSIASGHTVSSIRVLWKSPLLICWFPQSAPTIAIGEKASDMIMEDLKVL